MGFTGFVLSTYVVVLVFLVIDKSDGLQCFNCQAAVPPSGEDPCRLATLQSCPQSSTQCLSAKFSISAEPFTAQEQIISAQSCFPDMNGNECEMFLNQIRQLTPSAVKIEYREKCKLCSTDGCNSASGIAFSSFLIVGVWCILLYFQ